MAGISLHLYNTVHMILENMFKYVIYSRIYTKKYCLGNSTELQTPERHVSSDYNLGLKTLN